MNVINTTSPLIATIQPVVVYFQASLLCLMTHCIAEQFHQMAQYFAEHQIVKLTKDTSLDNQNLKNKKKIKTQGGPKMANRVWK